MLDDEIVLPPYFDGWCGSCLIDWHEICGRGTGNECSCPECGWYWAENHFKAALPDEYAAAWANGEDQEHQRGE